jgi:hypothetical protein
MRIWHTFAMQTMKSFFQTIFLPPRYSTGILGMAQLGFNLPQVIDGGRHISTI